MTREPWVSYSQKPFFGHVGCQTALGCSTAPAGLAGFAGRFPAGNARSRSFAAPRPCSRQKSSHPAARGCLGGGFRRFPVGPANPGQTRVGNNWARANYTPFRPISQNNFFSVKYRSVCRENFGADSPPGSESKCFYSLKNGLTVDVFRNFSFSGPIAQHLLDAGVVADGCRLRRVAPAQASFGPSGRFLPWEPY